MGPELEPEPRADRGHIPPGVLTAIGCIDDGESRSIVICLRRPSECDAYKRLFGRLGFHVEMTSDTLKALQSYQRLQPGFILTDVPILEVMAGAEQMVGSRTRYMTVVGSDEAKHPDFADSMTACVIFVRSDNADDPLPVDVILNERVP